MSEMCFDDFDYNRKTCDKCGFDYDDREGCDCELTDNENCQVDLQVSKLPRNIYGTVKILERLLEQAENNNGIISITDALLKDLIENTKQEYRLIYEQARQSC